jgi:ATP-dependent Clp endopeptidase proteolytic subunit ClpP
MEAKITPETESTKKSLDLYIYDVVTDYEYDFENDEIKVAETSSKHVREMLSENEDVEYINIYINSVGGSIYEGLAIYNQLKRSKAYKTVYIDGFACSIASVIAMAGDKIIMPKATMLMIHNAWTVAVGNAKELRKVADDLDIMSDTIAQAYLEKANGKLEEGKLRKIMDGETYLPAEECLKYGLCDEISEKSESPAEKAVAEIKQTASMMAHMKAYGVPAVKSEEVPADPEQKTVKLYADGELFSEAEPEEPEQQEEPAEEITADNDDLKDETPLDKEDKETVETFMKIFSRKVEK